MTRVISPSEFKALLPAFADESDARIRFFIRRAVPYFDAERWGDLYCDGVMNLVAHELVMSSVQAAQGGGARAQASDAQVKKVGDVQITKDMGLLSKQADNPFYRTAYGQRYLYLLRLVGAGALSV